MSEEIIEENHPKNVLDDNLRLQMDELSTHPEYLPVIPMDVTNDNPSLLSIKTSSVPCKGFLKNLEYFDDCNRAVKI